jgi:hypothetical protein
MDVYIACKYYQYEQNEKCVHIIQTNSVQQ